MRHRVQRLATVAGLASFLLASPGNTAFAADKFVTMYASKYLPGVVTINAGDSVTWVNDDDVPHDAVGNGWSTSLLAKGDSDSVTFRQAGRYRYSCSIHPQMRSAVVVRGAGGATVPPTDAAIERPERAEPTTFWLTIALGLVAGAALLLALLPKGRTRPDA